MKRLTFIGGVRFEQLEGYLPAQSSPPSPFAAAGIGGFAAQPRSYDESPRRREVEHRRDRAPARSSTSRATARRRQKPRPGATTTCCRPAAAASATSTANAQLQRTVHVERPQRRSQVPARRADRHAGRQRGGRQRRDSDVDRSELQPAVHRRVQLRRRSRARRPTSSSARSTPIGGRRTCRRRRTRDNLYATTLTTRRRSGHRRRGRHGRRRHLRLLPAALGGEPVADHQRSERRAELQGSRNHGDQAALQPVADAGRLHAVEEPARQRQRRHVAELPDQRQRQHHRTASRSTSPTAEPVQADRDVHPAVARRDRQRQLPVAAGAAGDAPDQPRRSRSARPRRSTSSRSATRASTR